MPDRLAPQSFRMGPTWYSLGEGHLARAWYVWDLASPLSRPRLEEFYALCQRLGAHLHLRWVKLESHLVRQALQQQLTMLQAGNVYDASKGKLPDTASLHVSDSLERLLYDLDGPGREPLFYLTLLVQLTAEGEEALEEGSRELELAMRDAGFSAHRATFQMEEAFRSMLPLGLAQVGTVRLINAGGLSLFFPFYRREYVDPRGFYFGVNRHSGTVVVQEVFKSNGVCVVLGVQGSGKSVAFKTLAEQAAFLGMRLSLFDLEGEYRPLVEFLRGSYLDMSVEAGARINVLDLSPHDPDGFPGQFGDLTDVIEVILDRPLAPQELSALDVAYREALLMFGIDPQDRGTWGREGPLLSHLVEALRASLTLKERGLEKVAQNLAAELSIYAEGVYSPALNCQTNVNLSNPVLAFGFQGVRTERLKQLRVHQALKLVMARVLRADRLSVTGVDEAWWYLQSRASARALANATRRFRKRGGSIWFLSHRAEDFLQSEDCRLILSSAGVVMLMKQPPLSLEGVAKLRHLTDTEVADIARLDPGGAVLIVSDGRREGHIPLQVVPNPKRWPLLDTSYHRVEERGTRNRERGARDEEGATWRTAPGG